MLLTSSGLLIQLLVGVSAGLAVTTLANVCTTVYLHRGVAHRAIKFRRPADLAFRVTLWLSTGIRVRQWVAVHRKHHAHTDTPEDPHSPAVHGWWAVQRGNYRMYRRAARDTELVAKYARDLPPTAFDRRVLDRPMLGLGLGVATLVVALGPIAAVVAAAVHINYYLAASAAVNAIGHHFGRRPYANSATNLQWLALLTAGEGLHNNHHAAPTSAKLSHRWYEIDPGWWVVRALTLLGLARVRLDPRRTRLAQFGG